MGKRLIIISNRLPVNIETRNKTEEVKLSSGGLVSAISSYLERKEIRNEKDFDETIWVGVPGCSESIWNKVKPGIPSGSYEYVPVFCTRKDFDGYYNGMSNSVLWALFHYFPSFAEFNSISYEQYQKVNRDFFDVLEKRLRKDDIIWIHDYHLLPLAGMIRKERPDVTIGFFLHIPFPSYEIFRIMPTLWQKELLEGMMGADLLGFHTEEYASYFVECVKIILNIEHQDCKISWENRIVKAGVFPISIDFDKFFKAYDDSEVEKERTLIRSTFAKQKVIFSADRLDYTKGVYNRLKAYEHFLKVCPEYREKVVFVIVIVPSRDAISKYAERKKMIDEYIGSMNGRIGNYRWQPVIYQYNSLSFTELMAMYTSCDLALITPVRDGMNLVAKEFVASRKDKKGVLVLSEMTGAARELTGALTINPTDTEEIAEQIRTGLEMSISDQSSRIAIMQERIKQYDVIEWAEDFLSKLNNKVENG